jgi:hypothetical protein
MNIELMDGEAKRIEDGCRLEVSVALKRKYGAGRLSTVILTVVP